MEQRWQPQAATLLADAEHAVHRRVAVKGFNLHATSGRIYNSVPVASSSP